LNPCANAARRAVEASPSNHLAYFSLAQALFFQKEFQSFRNAAERAVTLNPMDGNSIAFLGELLSYAGDWERGLALVRPPFPAPAREPARAVRSAENSLGGVSESTVSYGAFDTRSRFD